MKNNINEEMKNNTSWYTEEEMNNNIIELKSIFESIKKQGWIRSSRYGSTGIGKTFEDLLNKREENFEIPDFQGIEIKTRRMSTKRDITLFSAAPDGTYLFETERIRKKYGHTVNGITTFYKEINSIKYSQSFQYKFILKVDHDTEKIYLHVYNKDDILVDSQTYWSFEMIREKLERKLNYLALIKAINYHENEIEYFKYTQIKIYKKVNFQNFIELIEKDKITIIFKIGTYTDGNRYGKTKDHGTAFIIKENYLRALYDQYEL